MVAPVPAAWMRPLPALVGAVAAGAAAWWLAGASVAPAAPRLPGADRPAGAATAAAPVDLAGTFTAGPGAPADLPGSWPSFRGPERSNVVAGGPALAPDFPAEGPRRLWSLALGYGYAAPAVADGRVYLLDYDQAGQADALRCLSLADGREIWRRSHPVRVKFNHGMSRTVPAVAEGHVVALGPRCHVVCCDAVSGGFRWGIDLVRAYGAKEPPWYAGQCPLIDHGRAILAPAGPEALVVAVGLEDGRERWRTPNPHGWTMTHSSLAVATLGGRRQFVYCGSGGVAGLDAEDGRLLWTTSLWKVGIANVPTPIDLGDGRLFVCGGYGAGAAFLRVAREGDGWTVAVERRLAAHQFGSDQQTPVLHDGHLYGVVPDGQLVCLGLDGARRWASGAGERFGLGPYLVADGALWLLDDHGTLTTADAAPGAYRRRARARVLPGHDAWGPLALAGTRLLARDLDRLVCLEVGKP